MTHKEYCQPELFDVTHVRTADEVRKLLEGGRRLMAVDLTVTRNRVSMITVVFDGRDRVRIRMHEAFLSAPEGVLRGLRNYLRSHRRADWSAVAAFARNIEPAAAPGKGSSGRLRACGRHFDLKAIAEEVNRTFFDSRVRYRIGWGRARGRSRRPRRVRSMRMGSWNPATREVRIHPLLDDGRVPHEFMRYLVYHELLHAVVPSVRCANGRRDHPAEFRVLERRFPGVKRMHRLADELMNKLLG